MVNIIDLSGNRWSSKAALSLSATRSHHLHTSGRSTHRFGLAPFTLDAAPCMGGARQYRACISRHVRSTSPSPSSLPALLDREHRPSLPLNSAALPISVRLNSGEPIFPYPISDRRHRHAAVLSRPFLKCCRARTSRRSNSAKRKASKFEEFSEAHLSYARAKFARLERWCTLSTCTFPVRPSDE
jgi:hypothetical protein